MQNIRGISIRVLDDGNLETGDGLIIPNPFLNVQFKDPNSVEFKGELWKRIWAENLYVDMKANRIRNILVNLLSLNVSTIVDVLRREVN